MSAFTSVLSTPIRPVRLVRALARWALGLVLLAWMLVLVAWLILHWAILPHIDDWRGRIEQQASSALGLKLSIGSIHVESNGWVPAIQLRDLRFTDAGEREVLRLPMVAAALSARSLLAFSLHFEQLLIEAPRLEVRRNKQGKIFVAGLNVDDDAPAASNGAELADWFFSQHEFVILHGELQWVDETRDATRLNLSDVNLVIRNGLRHHDLRLDATPPLQWGERLSLRGRFTHPLLKRAGDLRQWSGEFFADLPRTDVRELKRHVQLPFELSEGDGALRAWIAIKAGKTAEATVDLGLRAVKLRLSPKVEAIDLEQVQGRLAWQHDNKVSRISATGLGFVTGDGLHWPPSDLSVKLSQVTGKDGMLGPVTAGEFSAQRLDLAAIGQIGARLPIGDALQRLLSDLQAQGVASEVSAQWEGPLDQPKTYAFKSTLKALSFAAKPSSDPMIIGRPGLRNAELQLSANERGGSGRLHIERGALEFPGVFEEPMLPLDRLTAGLSWRIEARPAPQAAHIEVKLDDVNFANADASGRLEALWSTGPGADTGRGGRYPGQLELSGRLDRAHAASTARYLPLQIPAATRQYVRDAIQSGTARDASFKVRGDLWDFPFDSEHPGEFHIAGRAQDVLLAYVPSHPASGNQPAWESNWPVMEHVNADLVFDRASMAIRNGRAKVYGFDLTGVNGGIRNLGHEPALELEGAGRGPLADLLRFMRNSPVGEWTGQGLTPATGTGNADLNLALQIPLHDLDKSTVRGTVRLSDDELQLRPGTPLLANAKGRINFSHKGVSLQGVTARALGGELSIEGGSTNDGSLRFAAQGVASAEGLRRTADMPELARLAQSFRGQAGYRLELGIVRGNPEFRFTSDLQGMALDLPAPLRKEAVGTLNLRVQTQLTPESRSGSRRPGAQDQLRIELGNQLQAQYLRDLSGPQPRVVAGAIALQETLPALPPSGVLAVANPVTLNVDGWSELAERVLGADAKSEASVDSGYAPTSLNLRAQEVQLGGRRLHHFDANIRRPTASGQTPDPGVWRATVEADQLKGFIEYRDARNGTGRIYARLSRLSLPKSDVESVESLLDQQPSSVPALDIVVDDFELRGMKLGKLEVEAQHSGATREWRLSRLQISQPDAALSATGKWVAEAGQTRRRALMDFKLSLADGGNLLERLGMGRVVRGGKGEMSGQISWLGSPFSPDYPSMTGQLVLALDAGQFLKADPGVGRLLGVLSLQALPRRFLLDFRDLFQEGFAFDSFSGNFDIAQGMASTNNLRMRGVSAAVLMEGHADLARETQDLRVVVVPEISATTASLAYAAINPAIGLGTLLAQLLLSKPMAAANTREFHVTGSWADPKVERVERKTPDAAAEASAPAASAP